ncbi:PIR protein CIR protein [Plasmodium vinckei vinckei]|uniref:PIR protein CIR protein n=1 Tax=Plasmodium vinckei vinckei TaxID=54757 RepID=A0A449BXA7_PLAVN|nr:PIR protein CIR protein [Plasmodium vinckei vinckei]VEV58068.1 PIR protein CIR protein [Plasmodium vinckei vinckei]
MANPSCDIKDVYKEISTIDGYFGVEYQTGIIEHAKGPILNYCPYNNTFGYSYCSNYLHKASSGVINLLENLKKYNLEYDKLAEYAILLLSYKLNQHLEHKSTDLNKFYTTYIEKNNHYNKKINGDNGPTYKDIINTKKDLMNIKEMSKFNGLFSILFSFYNEINKNKWNCENHSTKAKEFIKNFEELNNDSNINRNTSYSKLLSTLSDDYNNLKNKCTDFPSLPKIKTPPSTLIPVLSTFPVIPVFLGVAYKVNNKELKL